MDLDAVLHLLPRSGAPTPLYIHLHGEGAGALAMAPVADRFAQAWPQAAHLLPDVSDAGGAAAALARLAAFVADAQATLCVPAPATALVGFGSGGSLALAFAGTHPARVGRVIAIAGRYAALPEVAPQPVVHLVHGKEDGVVPARHTVEAATRLVALGADVTADVVPGVGHTLHPALLDAAIGHLQTFLPRRVWAQALAEAPLVATRAHSRDLARPTAPPAANDPG